MSVGEVGRHLVWVLDRGWWEPSLDRRGGASSKSWTVSIWQPMDVGCKGGTQRKARSNKISNAENANVWPARTLAMRIKGTTG